MYKQKYFKYKQKYLKLKGGSYFIELINSKQIENKYENSNKLTCYPSSLPGIEAICENNININNILFSNGSNNFSQLAGRLKTTYNDIKRRSAPSRLDSFKRVFTGKSNFWGNSVVASFINSPDNQIFGFYTDITNDELDIIDIYEGDTYEKQKYTIVNTIEKTNIEAYSFIRKKYIGNGITISSSYLLSIAMLLYDRRLLSVNKDESNIVIDIIYKKSDYNGINKNNNVDFTKNKKTFIFKNDTDNFCLNFNSSKIEATFKGFIYTDNILTNITIFKTIFKTILSNDSQEEKLRCINVWLNCYIGRKNPNIVLLNPNKIKIFINSIEINLFKFIKKEDIDQYIVKCKDHNQNIFVANEEYTNKFKEYLKLFIE